MIVWVVVNAYRAIIYAGDNQSVVDDLLRPAPLNPGDRLGDYAERWENGVPVSAWSRKNPGWVEVEY